MKKILILLVLLLSIFSFGCNIRTKKTDVLYDFGTTISIDVKCTKDEFNKICSIFEEYNKLTDSMRSYTGVTNIYDLNKERTLELDSKLVDLVKYAYQYEGDTFSILLGKVSKIYKRSIQTKYLPDTDELNDAINDTLGSSIEIDGNIVSIIGNADIDLGAVAKGYALKIVLEYLKENGIEEYLINAGSSSIALGEKKNNYKVLIKNTSDVMSLKNTCIGVSGIDEQEATIDNTLIHHLINPVTFKPDALYDKVVVVGGDPALLDILSTSFMFTGFDDITCLEKDFGVSVILYQNGSVLYDSIGIYEEE